MALPILDASLRSVSDDEQRQTLAGALDTLDTLAGERDARLAVVMDEFQEIHRLGGEAAEWHLRGGLESHANLSYVLAGSRTGLIERMISDPNRAFYKLLDVLSVGPIEEKHFCRWIDDRMAESGRAVAGAGSGLTSPETMTRFGLPNSGTVSNTAGALVDDGLLVRVDPAPGYDFENPFVRGWVVMQALPDIGIERPVTWRATLGR